MTQQVNDGLKELTRLSIEAGGYQEIRRFARYAHHMTWSDADKCFVVYCVQLTAHTTRGTDVATVINDVLRVAQAAESGNAKVVWRLFLQGGSL